MNTSTNHRFLKVLATLATLSVAVFTIGFAFDVHPLALFSFATSALILLGAARDYAPTLSCADNDRAFAAASRGASERHPLAA